MQKQQPTIAGSLIPAQSTEKGHAGVGERKGNTIALVAIYVHFYQRPC